MTLKVAINGFGRIGRLVLRQLLMQTEIEVVAINDLVSADSLAYLFKYDSTHGVYGENVSFSDNELIIGEKRIKVFAETKPENLPWKKLQVDFVVESTGVFTTLEKAKEHLKAGAKKVVITAPAKDAVPTYVMGVNHHEYQNNQDVVSNASCTTNCLAPVAKILNDKFEIEEGLMTTVHAVTASQPSVDSPAKKDFRAGRGAFQNIIPSSTGAAKAVGLCLPALKGKLTGMALRVPVADVSVVDLTVKLHKPSSYEEVCHSVKQYAQGPMKGILAYSEEPLVSSDLIGSTYSSIFDAGAGIALNERFFKLIMWYDNEMGYSCRVVDLIVHMSQTL